jgi:hypothetical protein
MPKFILAAVVGLFPPRPSRADEMHANTRSWDATRRLRASKAHDPYVDISPLALTRRH